MEAGDLSSPRVAPITSDATATLVPIPAAGVAVGAGPASPPGSPYGHGHGHGHGYGHAHGHGGPRTPMRGGGRGRMLGPQTPNSCLVLKNLDYKITSEELEEVVRRVAGGRKQFVNINLVHDATTKQFRGMAFVNFHSVDEATSALGALSKMSINNRKVVAEYRRLRPGEKMRTPKSNVHHIRRTTFESEVATDAVDADGNMVDKRKAFFSVRDSARRLDERTRERNEKADRDREREATFRTRLLEYQANPIENDDDIEDISFEPDLTSYERRMVHVICDEIGLGHMSVMGDDGVRVLKVTKHPARMTEWAELTADIRKAANERKDEDKRRRKEEREAAKQATANLGNGASSPPAGNNNASRAELEGIKWFKPRAAIAANGDVPNASNALKAPQYRLYTPPRQPTGPDGTTGFHARKFTAGIIDHPPKEEDDENNDDHQLDINETQSPTSTNPSHNETAIKAPASQTPLNPSVAPFTPSAAAYAT